MSGCFNESARRLFKIGEQTELLDSLEQSYAQLLKQRVDFIEYGDRSKLTFADHTKKNCEAVKQVALHRIERLFSATNTLLVDANVYGLALVVRGAVETTAVLGYLCSKTKALSAGSIKIEDYEWIISDALLGARHKTFSEARPSVNVLSAIEKADRFLDEDFFGEKRGVLRDCYDWLSEFCHPNFLSNVGAFFLDKGKGRFVFRTGQEHRDTDLQILGYLGVVGPLFVFFFDKFSDLVGKAPLD